MANILDYLKWRGDLSFEHCPFNDVDSLLLAVISHIDFGGIVPSGHNAEGINLPDVADRFFAENDGMPSPIGLIVPAEIFDVFDMMMRAPRYKDVKMTFFVDDVDVGLEKQFSALTYVLPYGQGIYVVYRGTDDTLVGWKEDFNMSFMTIVPSQVEALKYIELAGRRADAEKIMIGGHSKGGNLAVFGGCFCSEEVKKKITKIYCSDAPGFSRDMLESNDYAEIRERIIRILPDTSVVGMLLENDAPCKVVKSSAKGVRQHDPFTWQVLGDEFEKGELSESCLLMKETLDRWLADSSQEQLMEIVNSLYVFLSSTEATTLTELNENRKRLMGSMRQMSPETKRSIITIAKLMTGVESKKITKGIKQRFFKNGGQD